MPNGAAEGVYVIKQVSATGSEWVVVVLEDEEWIGLERMVFGARGTEVEFGIGIDSSEFGMWVVNFFSICLISIISCKQVFVYFTENYLMESLHDV